MYTGVAAPYAPGAVYVASPTRTTSTEEAWNASRRGVPLEVEVRVGVRDAVPVVVGVYDGLLV